MAATLSPPLVSAPPQSSPPTSETLHSNNHRYRRRSENQNRYAVDYTNPTILPLIEQCSSTAQAKQIHAQMLRRRIFFDSSYYASRLFALYALSDFSPGLDYARKVFDQMPQPNVYSWNTLIRAYASSSEPVQSFLVFLDMIRDCPDSPNKFTFPFLIKAASELAAKRVGMAVHGMAVKGSFDCDVFVLNALIHFYASCGDLVQGYKVFSEMPERDVVSWNSMINALAQDGESLEKVFRVFEGMLGEGAKPNDVTMVGVFSACAKTRNLGYGRWFHSFVVKNGIEKSLILNNAMLDMYTKCESLCNAKRVFENMGKKDIVSWTTMLSGYAKMGEFDAARIVFNAMPCQDIAAWNALISAYEQNGHAKEALALFHELLVSKYSKPDEVTLVSSLSACAQLGAAESGSWIHVYMKKHGVKLNCHLTTSLIDMYAKGGCLDKALEVFQSAEKKDVYVWSAMIAAFAMHGRGNDAIDIFKCMQEAMVKPNAVTFTNVLCACSHAGLVEEGRFYFNQMLPKYGVVPQVKHYSCMVDILGRGGFLEEAIELIEKMPFVPGASVWGALLGSCRTYGTIEQAEHAFSHLIELEPRNHGAYVLMSNIYAKFGMWDGVSRLRKHMKEFGIKKEPGCSSIEVDDTVHEFLVGDNSHSQCREIYLKLDEIAERLKSNGYVPNKSQLLQDIEEENVKEQALYSHSEKIAIAFGLIKTTPSTPLRIMKNLRVCGDCHTVAKLISKLYDREIILRDRYRFHYLKEGQCSCMDYW
ncbi:hypothetical protein Sjap_001005 [Stephania japonica]|uniref:DYW domain-containing protein n=1 Tax=Stephania japonica TaxID=461633 RepID=A0AAP0KLP5_9MAGN